MTDTPLIEKGIPIPKKNHKDMVSLIKWNVVTL